MRKEMDSEGWTIVTEYAARSSACFKISPSRGKMDKKTKGVKSSFRVRVKVGCRMG